MSPRSLAPCSLAQLARELDRRLVGLGAGVGEEDAIGEGVLAEQLGEVDLLRDVEVVGDVQQRGGLLAHGPDHLGMAVAERRHRDAAGEVEVLLAIRVPDARRRRPRTSATGIALGEGHQVLVRPLHQLFGVHGSSFPVATFVQWQPSPRPARPSRDGDPIPRQRMISVPMPSLVRTSSRIACATRPSMMCAFWAPPAERAQGPIRPSGACRRR